MDYVFFAALAGALSLRAPVIGVFVKPLLGRHVDMLLMGTCCSDRENCAVERRIERRLSVSFQLPFLQSH